MPNYTEQALKKLKSLMKKEYVDDLKDQEDRILFLFEGEKMWKNLIFPPLTPIYTR